MSTYNICFHGEIKKNINIFGLKKTSYDELCHMLSFPGEIRKVIVWLLLLSGAMTRALRVNYMYCPNNDNSPTLDHKWIKMHSHW